MKQCPKCKMNVRGSRDICPLCQGALIGEGEEDIYPVIPSYYRQYTLFFKILALVTISSGIISVMMNIMLNDHGAWSLFVVVGIACFWVMLAFAFRKRNNIPKNIMYQVFFIALFSIIWDKLTGWRGWSLDFVVPIAFIVGMGAMIIAAIILHSSISDYIILLLSDGLFGLAPLAFLLLNKVRIVIPSYICIAFSIISFTALFIFCGKSIVSEAQKRFHV